MDYYKKLSWSGLFTSTIYKGFSEKKKKAIEAVILKEQNNEDGAKGKKCN